MTLRNKLRILPWILPAVAWMNLLVTQSTLAGWMVVVMLAAFLACQIFIAIGDDQVEKAELQYFSKQYEKANRQVLEALERIEAQERRIAEHKNATYTTIHASETEIHKRLDGLAKAINLNSSMRF